MPTQWRWLQSPLRYRFLWSVGPIHTHLIFRVTTIQFESQWVCPQGKEALLVALDVVDDRAVSDLLCGLADTIGFEARPSLITSELLVSMFRAICTMLENVSHAMP